jgi:hypothetical protein
VCGCTGGNPPQPKCCNPGGNCGTGQCPAGTTVPPGMTCPSGP